MKNLLKGFARALLVVIHDPDVQRSGKQFAAKIAARLVLAAGGGAFWVGVVERAIG